MRVQSHPGAGVEITDVELHAVSDATFADIEGLFAQHGLVFFRDQHLSEDDHIAFARRFGTINVNRFFPHHSDFPEIALVAKEPDQRGNIGGGWHTDHSYDDAPALGSILVARELPDTGGDTWFVNTADAFDRLSPEMQQRLRSLRGVHSTKHIFGSRGAWLRRLMGAEGLYGGREKADALPDVTQPVVIRHPLSGRESLYVNPGFTIGIEGKGWWTSWPLLASLYRHTLRDPHVAKFRWAPGSVAIWDNRATWHYARNDYRGERRVMHRITLEGCPLEPSVVPPGP